MENLSAKDLRIGNKLFRDRVVVTIDARSIFDLWDDGVPEKYGYKPIPLTEEWLLRLNAKKEKDGVFCYSRFRLIFFEAYNYWYVTEKTDKNYISKV